MKLNHTKLLVSVCIFTRKFSVLTITLFLLKTVHTKLNLQYLIFDFLRKYRSSHPEVFLEKGVLQICSKFTGEHPYRSVISKKLQNNFIEITLWHACSPVNLLHYFRTPFNKKTSGRLLLKI